MYIKIIKYVADQKEDQQLNDTELLKGILVNDSNIIEIIYNKYFNSIFHFIRKNGGSIDEAKDIFQDAIMVLYDKVHFEDFKLTCQLKTFIFSICKNLWLKKFNQSKKSISLDYTGMQLENENINIEPFLKKENDFLTMNKALLKIGEPCKSLLIAFYFKKLDMQTISTDFGYTNADNAKNQKYKCLNRLKKYFFDLKEPKI